MVAPLPQCDVAPLRRIRTIVQYVLGESIVRANLPRVERTRPAISKPNPCAQPRLLRVSKRQVAHHCVSALKAGARVCDR